MSELWSFWNVRTTALGPDWICTETSGWDHLHHSPIHHCSGLYKTTSTGQMYKSEFRISSVILTIQNIYWLAFNCIVLHICIHNILQINEWMDYVKDQHSNLVILTLALAIMLSSAYSWVINMFNLLEEGNPENFASKTYSEDDFNDSAVTRP